MSTPERDEHFAQFAKHLFDDVEGMFMDLTCAKFVIGYEAEQAEIVNDIRLFLARRAYDLMSHGCLTISNAQMRSGGVCLHPNAMLREIPDMTELPEEPTPKKLDGKLIAREIAKEVMKHIEGKK